MLRYDGEAMALGQAAQRAARVGERLPLGDRARQPGAGVDERLEPEVLHGGVVAALQDLAVGAIRAQHLELDVLPARHPRFGRDVALSTVARIGATYVAHARFPIDERAVAVERDRFDPSPARWLLPRAAGYFGVVPASSGVGPVAPAGCAGMSARTQLSRRRICSLGYAPGQLDASHH